MGEPIIWDGKSYIVKYVITDYDNDLVIVKAAT